MTKVRFRGGGRSRWGILLIGALCFLLCVGVGLAVADPGPEEPASEAALLVPESQAGELPSGEGSSVEAGPETNPQAAAELPHSELGRAEAEELLTAVFPAALEEPAGIFNGELEVEEFHSDHVAVVAPPRPGAQPGLLSSLLPLRTEDAEGEKEAVDLELERAEGEVDPTNPLVEVQIPSELGEGAALPESHISISFAGDAAQRSASVVEGAATFYPNVAPDTDLALAPTPLGLESFTQLRSAQAPLSQTYRLSLPAGASLKASAEGGAEITEGEEVLVAVPPPSAIDAEGNEVPVSLSVSGDSITLHVEPQPEAPYPYLVDPVYESYSWMNSGTNTGIYSDWRAASSNESVFKPNWIGVWGETMHAGLDLRSYPGAAAPGYQANWNYYVPRFFSDYENPEFRERPTSFIRSMTLSQVYFLIEESSPVHEDPYLLVGLWDEKKGEFSTVNTRTGAKGGYSNQTITLKNESEYVEVKNGGIALATAESASYPRQAFVGSATVELSDKDSPEFTSLLKGPGSWVNEAAAGSISYSAADHGLGVYALQVTQGAQKGGVTFVTTPNQCLGTAGNPCPREATTGSRVIAYEPKTMPQGEDWVKVTASDPVGHVSPVEEVPIKVDHTAPKLSLSGNLTEQATAGTHLTSYTLNYAAADGDETAPAAQAPIGTTGTGAGQMERPFGVAVDGKGDLWVADRENTRVEEFNEKGELIRQFGSAGSGNGQFSDPRGIAVSASGNVWVTDLANKRVQEFNEKGEFIRSVTYAGGPLGQGKMVEPYSVATGPEETLWVGDVGSHRVYQFKENGTFVKAIASAGPLLQETSLTTPAGIAVDRFGDAYVAEQSSSQIIELGPGGSYVNKFGSAGTGQGQLSGPVGLAIAPSGNLLVADANNNRIEEFKPDGTFLREFGALGSEASQLKEPRGIATGAENTLYVADAGNHRIAKWTHADKDPQSGVASVEIKVDNVLQKREAPGCATRNCQITGSWTLNPDNFPAGHHEVEVIATDGVGLPTPRKFEIETHGDYAAPQLALSGTITEEAKLGNTRPSYKLKAAATDPGSAEERKSGVASITIKVDGAVVDSTSPGCPAEGCSLSREWTLTSNNYSPGNHSLEVIATDAAGHSTTKTLAITIERDTTAPTLSPESKTFFEAPKGWLEQKKYVYYANATDPNGYGVVSLEMKIDGKAVATTSGTCAAGNCSKTLLGEINMANYSGGAHPAELIATDGAGNWRKRTWTINVDPSGQVGQTEAEETLEALDETSPVNTVGEAVAEENYEGTAEGLELRQAGESLEAVGVLTPSSVGPKGELSIEVPPVEAFISCPNRPSEETSEELTGAQEEELASTVGCAKSELVEAGGQPAPLLEVTPVATGAGTSTLTSEESAALNPNAATEADLVTRPLIDGGMSFTAIRGPQAPENYGFTLELEEGMYISLLDPQHAVVMYPDGIHHALSITAVEAHDAIGTTVPTSLSVSGNIVTLHVPHKTGAYIYPVVAGAGWEGGFQTTEVEMPSEETPNEGAIESAEFGIGTLRENTYGPPGPASAAGLPDPWAHEDTNLPITHRGYNFFECTWHKKEGWEESSGPPNTKYEEEIKHGCHGETAAGYVVTWAISVSGEYKFKRGKWALVSNNPNCQHWGPDQPAKLKCYATPLNQPSTPRALAVGDYRFPPAHYQGVNYAYGHAVCYRLNGPLPDWFVQGYPGEGVLETKYHLYIGKIWPEDQCDWDNLEKEF